MLAFTQHARARLQQRGIPQGLVSELLDFGQETHDHRGTSIVYFNRQARERLRRACGDEEYRRIESHLNAYAVIGRQGQIITVGYAMDAAETKEPKGVLPVEQTVRQFIEEMKAADTQSFKALGEGDDVRLEGESIVGGALVRGERVVHLAAFTIEAGSPKTSRRARRSAIS